MKYLIPGCMIALTAGASIASASPFEARDAPKFYHGDAKGPEFGDVKIASKNPAGGPLGAVLAGLLPPGSEWFGKNVIKSVGKKNSEINVRGSDLDKVVTESVDFSEVKEHLYGAEDVLWVDSVAIALARAGWSHRDGPLDEMDVGQALTALTGRPAVKVFDRSRMDEGINEFNASPPPTGTLEDFTKALGSYSGRKTPVILVTAESATKCKKNHAYALSFLDNNWRLYDPSAEKVAEDSKRTIEEIFADVSRVWGVKDAEEFL